MAPCAALALCSSPKVKSCCCTKAEDCCCREAGQRNTAPTPAATVANPLLDQAAEVTVGNTSGLVAPVSTGALGGGVSASGQVPAPIYITSCTFRC